MCTSVCWFIEVYCTFVSQFALPWRYVMSKYHPGVALDHTYLLTNTSTQMHTCDCTLTHLYPSSRTSILPFLTTKSDGCVLLRSTLPSDKEVEVECTKAERSLFSNPEKIIREKLRRFVAVKVNFSFVDLPKFWVWRVIVKRQGLPKPLECSDTHQAKNTWRARILFHSFGK